MKSLNLNYSKPLTLSRLKQDLLFGIVAVLIVVCALTIFYMGTMSPLEVGFNFNFIVLGLMGAVIAELLKSTLTGKHLTPVEIFQNILLTGLLAVSSSRLTVFQAPSSWSQVLMMNKVIATVTFLIYQLLNIRSLVFSHKHLGSIIGVSVIGTPYLLNWLMLLEDITIIQILIDKITAGSIAAWPMVVKVTGRLLVAFIFNEVVVNGFSLVIRGKILKGFKLHAFIFFVSLGVVISPLIADLGSGETVASLPFIIRAIVAILATMFSFAGLWGEVYLITGMAIDSGKHTPPSWKTISEHVKTGMRKGIAYSGILLGLLYTLYVLLNANVLQIVADNLPILFGILSGALVFPLLKTIVETFDGSLPFSQRVRYNYCDMVLYSRGAVAGFGFAYAFTHNLIQQDMSDRILFGLTIGLFASAGISVLRDMVYVWKGQGKVRSWRLYFTDALLGVFIGSAVAFYIDSLQVPVVIEKFKLYTSTGFSSRDYITYPLVCKWGRIDLGSYTGGAKLLFIESLAGVINWSIAAWLFAINKVLLQAALERHTVPIKFFFSKEGFAQLIEHMIFVLRWGLWMSPIIFTFLRMMPEPTWYNQDGAIRTLFATYHRITESTGGFRAWSLQVFTYILAYDFFRVLIWMDHMGLRVATLVNLSFLGLDRLDERVARFIGPAAAAQRYIPEAIKRFATWGPLLIPFYLPRAKDWDYAWSTAEAIQNARGGGVFSIIQSLTLFEKFLFASLAILAFTGISFSIRFLRSRTRRRQIKSCGLSNKKYKVILKENGEVYSEVLHGRDFFPKEFDISRRSYDIIDPCGRTLYLVDINQSQNSKRRFWPVIGNFPAEEFRKFSIKRYENSLRVLNIANGVRTTIDISLPGEYTTAELWNITIKNLTSDSRHLKVVPYLEWLLNGAVHDKFHTQYARLFIAMEYVSQANAILAWQRSLKTMGILAVDIPPEGFLTSRYDFIGRAQSIWKPRVLETLNFLDVEDTERTPTFDPIGSLMVGVDLDPKTTKTIHLMIGYTGNEEIGYAGNKKVALELINQHLKPTIDLVTSSSEKKKKSIFIGHGEILPETPKPYFKYKDNGNKLLVRTPYTPRPFDHALSNSVGHSVIVTNRGLHSSTNGNSQQNRLTRDWADTVTEEVPSEAIYLYDPDRSEWYCPTYHPLNSPEAKNESEFSVDGTAVFYMTHKDISTELTVFVPPDERLGVYLLTVKNNANYSRKIRIASYFQMLLGFQPDGSGSLLLRHDKESNTLFFNNPRNMFRKGWAFVSVSMVVECVETRRGKFFGTGRGVRHPFMVENGKPDITQLSDNRQVAAFLGTLNIPAHEESSVVVIMGQTYKRKQAMPLIEKYKDIQKVRESLGNTRKWWLNLMGTMSVETNRPEFDYLQNWLKYQAIVERVWARRGFYQSSGAYGFRDQLQDAVNLLLAEPSLARKQIILHASHQFYEGDFYHWFFILPDGRTGFSFRSHTSDDPVWLVWGVVEYINTTGDYSILDERTTYVSSEFPFADLPKNKVGWGHLYHRSTRSDSIYKHCMRAINLVLEKRMGAHGLPLIRTGDWNDGLDEIGSEGRGESVWLGFFLYYVLKDMVNIIGKREGKRRKEHYVKKMHELKDAIEQTWRGDRYLRAIHDDGTEIGVKGSGTWEIDALTVAWAAMTDINFERSIEAFHTALDILEQEKLVLLGWPALHEDSEPYLGRSSKYPEGVRENGMYCHGVQWLIKAARIFAEWFEKQGDYDKAKEYRKITYRLWQKITPVSHTTPAEIEIYGGQPNKQPADILTNFQPGRMIWNGYTGAGGWLFRQSLEGIIGVTLKNNELILPDDFNKPRGKLEVKHVFRDLEKSPLGTIPSEAYQNFH